MNSEKMGRDVSFTQLAKLSTRYYILNQSNSQLTYFTFFFKLRSITKKTYVFNLRPLGILILIVWVYTVVSCTFPSWASVAGGVGHPRSEAPCISYRRYTQINGKWPFWLFCEQLGGGRVLDDGMFWRIFSFIFLHPRRSSVCTKKYTRITAVNQ